MDADPRTHAEHRPETFTGRRRCTVCGDLLAAGRCLRCDTRRLSSFVHREVVLLAVLAAVTAATFFVTRAIAASNAGMRRRDAADLFESGQRGRGTGGAMAVTAFRRAAAKDPENRQYRLALAGALAADGQDEEAGRVLAALNEANPEDPEVNLQLARLEARRSNTDATRRYYQSALAGLWRPEQSDARRRMRLELIEFLLVRGERGRALSELLVMAADVPDVPAIQTQMGALFLRSGDPRRALDHFVRALRTDPGRGDALAGAGTAAFELEDYARARSYLNAAPAGDRTAGLRALTALVLAGDPLAPRIGASERQRRAAAAVEQATRTLDQCVADAPSGDRDRLGPLQSEAEALASTWRARARRDPRDLVEEGLELAYRIEASVERTCPAAMVPRDRAILLIARRHDLDQP